jgi:transcriptional regulator with XRE-family HTH domain
MSTNNPARDELADPIDVLIGERINGLMFKRRLQKKDIAAILHIDSTAVGKKIRAEQKFSVSQLVRLAPVLGTTVGYLVGETEEAPTPKGEGRVLPGLDSNQEPIG